MASRVKFFFVLCVALILGTISDATAQDLVPKHGIAMHGTPALAEDFTHFPYTNPSAPKGGTLKLGVVGTFDSLHPFIVRGNVPTPPAFSLYTSSAVYERLMARSMDEPFALYGLLAQSIEVPPDRSFIIFNLNPRAHWSDGKPVTAEDVLFSFETLRDKGRPNHRTYYKKVSHAEKLSPLRVRFAFHKESDGSWDPEMPLIMGLMPVLPKHDWQDRPFHETTTRPPIASGPYKVSRVDVGRSVTLTRDPDYWGKAIPSQQGLYNFDTIQIDFYRDDSVALQAFKAGAFDVRYEPDPQQWTQAYSGPALSDGRLQQSVFPHKRTEAIRGFILNTRRPLFQDRALREALSLAFDFGWINKALFQGLFKRTESYVPNAELAAGRSLPEGAEKAWLIQYKDTLPEDIFSKPAFNIDGDGSLQARRTRLLQAAAVLKNAGYILRDATLVAPNGTPVTFDVMLSDPVEEKIALEWARALERLGIKPRIRTVDSAQYQARLNSFDYDVTVGHWNNSLSPGNEQMYFWSCRAAEQQGSRNYAGICDPVIDALAAAVPAAQTREELVAVTRALDRVLVHGHYVVPFYHLGATQIAFWQERLAHPPTTSLYGPILESWWAK